MKKSKISFVLLFQIFCIHSAWIHAQSLPQKAKVYAPEILKGNDFSFTKTGKNLIQISMPMGGIGSGSIGLSGIGSLIDFSIYGQPNFTAPDIWGSEQAGFAVLRVVDKNKKNTIRVVEGIVPREHIYMQGIKGQGFISSGVEGFPRFENCSFTGKYPMGTIKLSDDKLPIDVSLTGYNPFIPLDDKNSSIPCAILEYTLKNHSTETVDFEFSYNMTNLCGKNYYDNGGTTTRNSVTESGFLFSNTLDSLADDFGTVAVSVVDEKPLVKGMWLRSGWSSDCLSGLWRELSTGTFTTNSGSNGIDTWGKNGGSLLLKGKLKSGESKTYPIVIAWHFPNRNQSISYKKPCDTCNVFMKKLRWQPYYASQWKNANEVSQYIQTNYKSLKSRTEAFQKALYNSTIPNYVLDAVGSNLAIIKSPTLNRQQNGNLWGWEGITPKLGVGPGTNIHVYGYAQSLAHLFPSLERTLREQELLRSIDENGHVDFRAALPDGPSEWAGLPAADGQLGGIMKVYRDFRISGDLNWLKKMYEPAKKSINYCIETWDPKHKGIVEEPHHNTYDIEFWGPDGMNTSIYLGALSSMIELAIANLTPQDTLLYSELLSKGKRYMESELYNGKYFNQKVVFKGLRDTSFVASINNPANAKGEINQLLKKEGPRYQYANGCLSDGIIGLWMSSLYQIPLSMNQTKVNSHLKSVFEYNFKADLQASEHACAQRPGYALGHEPGLLLCTWPQGGMPTLPFVYSDEVWTGIEYQVASHLVMQGMVDEGLTIVRGTRYRYDGYARNPYAEYEFGSFYARAMSSYSLIESLSGIDYSAITKVLTIVPKVKTEKIFTSFFSTATGYGTININQSKLTITMIEGELPVSKIKVIINNKIYYFNLNETISNRSEKLLFTLDNNFVTHN
ncbi:MAG: GH116 family glycosyl hydrolase [Bacteroidales bacterium]|nr:GH116 family glycosyl hydrolase [Bacteroidales bacterium]